MLERGMFNHTTEVLPIEPLLPDLLETLGSGTRCILEAAPGAGKTTRVPLALLRAAWLDGKGILMAEKIGAATIDMGLIQLLPTCDAKTGSTSTKMASGTCIYVNKDGKRFVNELGRRDVLAKAALAQPDGMFFVISCESTNFVKDGRNMYGIRVKDLLDRKQVYSGETLEELAKNAGINPANLVKTVEAWQQFCKDLKGIRSAALRATPKRSFRRDRGTQRPCRLPHITRWADLRSTPTPRSSTRPARLSRAFMPPAK